MEKTIKINLGCGEDYKKGWINVDYQPQFKLEVHAKIFDFEYENNKVDEILLSHVAMYIRPEEMEVLLKRWYGWLKKGGSITIETINLDAVMAEASNPFNGKNKSWGLDNIFGPSNAQHKWGWRYDDLKEHLLRAGFKKIKGETGLKKPNRDYQLIATK